MNTILALKSNNLLPLATNARRELPDFAQLAERSIELDVEQARLVLVAL